jgi:rhodanese-related sulfurtransferase
MPIPIEPVPRLTIQQLRHQMDRGEPVYLIDVRERPDSTQIAGATYFRPQDLMGAERVVLPVPGDRLIVIYCDSPREATSSRIAQKLRTQGYVNAFPLFGGYASWRRRRVGYPIERRASSPG